jgi:glycosyltransferase involved in cell wall biosynthesis
MAKIAIVLHDLRGGGAEKMMVRLANQLAIMGDDMEMILLTGGGSNKAFLSPNVTLTELNAKRTSNAFSPLRRHLKVSKPNLILAALTHVNVITALVCASLGWSKRLSVSERNTFSLDKTVANNKVMKTAYAIAPYVYWYLPNPVIAVSQGVANDLVACSVVRHKDVVTAPNPVITDETIEASKQVAQHPWLANKKSKVIVAVGRLSHQKGFDMLLDAFFQIKDDVDAKLIIFGEGELERSLSEQIASLGLETRVSLAGYTNNPIAEIKNADLFVLSSRFEGSPNVLVEAMSVGTPVVAFNCPSGPFEILKGGKVAPLVPCNNTQLLADAMGNQLATQIDGQTLIDAVQKFTAELSATHYRGLMSKSMEK